MDKMLTRPLVATDPVTAVLEEADACVVGAIQGHMPLQCHSLQVEAVDTNGDGKLTVTIEVDAAHVARKR